MLISLKRFVQSQVPYEECKKWTDQSLKTIMLNSELAELQAKTASNIQKRFRLRKPYSLKMLFCKKCKKFSPPISKSIYRIRKKVLIVSCGQCGMIYRRPLSN